MELIAREENQTEFIDANTLNSNLPYLQEETIIPAFAKDNESTISHVEFVESMQEAAQMVFSGQQLELPSIKVSHPIKGRIPEAKGKPAKDLLEHEKTLYYERMAFMIEIPGINGKVGNDSLSLCLGGVRAYNQENLYNKKSPERFKIFIGFKNWVCTNLCVSTDGFLAEVKIQSISELQQHAIELFANYQHQAEISRLALLEDVGFTGDQFSYFVGRAKQYINLGKEARQGKPLFPLGDSQLSSLVREYHGLSEEGIGRDVSLWEVYNLLTSANKSSYIDSFIDRGVECLSLSESMANSLKSKSPHWFVNLFNITNYG